MTTTATQPRPDAAEHPPETLRVADLYCGNGCASAAAQRTGARIVYAYEPDPVRREAYAVRVGVEPDWGCPRDGVALAPPTDVLLANVAGDDRRLEHALHYLNDRYPIGVLLTGGVPLRGTDEVLTLGYRLVGCGCAVVGVCPTLPRPTEVAVLAVIAAVRSATGAKGRRR